MILSISLMGCQTPSKFIKPSINIESCDDWSNITATEGDDLIYQIRNNRINHTDCYLKLEEAKQKIKKIYP